MCMVTSLIVIVSLAKKWKSEPKILKVQIFEFISGELQLYTCNFLTWPQFLFVSPSSSIILKEILEFEGTDFKFIFI